MRRFVLAAAVVALLIPVTACGGGSSGNHGSQGTDIAALTGGYSVAGSLRALPYVSTTSQQPVEVFSADIAKAAELAHAPDPKDATSRGTWGLALSKGPVYVPFTNNLAVDYLVTGTVRKRLGFDVTDLTSFTGVESPPNSITVGRLRPGAGVTQGVTKTGDGAVGTVTTAHSDTGDIPFPIVLGVGTKTDQVALSQRTSLLHAWKAGGRSMAAHSNLREVAEALDAHHVYAATLFDGPPQDAVTLTPQQRAQITITMPDYQAVGIGEQVTDGHEVEYVAYAVADPKKVADRIGKVWRDGESIQSQAPLSTYAQVQHVTTTGHLVVVEIKVSDSVAPALQMLTRCDLPFAHIG